MLIHQITNKYFDTNSYIIEQKDKCIIVDPSFEPDKIIDYITRQNLIPVAILLTHGHNDHIFGVSNILSVYDIKVYCSSECSTAIRDPYLNLSYNEPVILSVNVETTDLEDNKVYNIENFEFKVYKMPGHSPGCLIYEFNEGLITGDFVMKRCVGTISYNASNYEQMINSISRFKTLYANSLLDIFPGHREQTTVQHELATNPFLKRPKSIKFLK